MQHFRLISEFIQTGTRPFGFADPDIINPVHTNPLIMGEFLQLDSAYKMARDLGTNPAVVPSFCFYAEQGAYDVQGLGKGPFLYLHSYEAETKIFTATGLGIGDKLEVADVSYGGLTRRGLVKFTTGHVIGTVTRIHNGWLRFRRTDG